MDNQEQEIWKDIKGYEGYYQISNMGRVKGLKRKFIHNEYIKKMYYYDNSYVRVSLRKKSKPKTFLVHRLVALAFIPNPENKKQVNHKDGNKQNNNVCNLEWVDNSTNMQHASIHNLLQTGEKHYNSKLTWDDVCFIRSHYKKYDKVYNTTTLGKMFNISPRKILGICNYETWKHK